MNILNTLGWGDFKLLNILILEDHASERKQLAKIIKDIQENNDIGPIQTHLFESVDKMKKKLPAPSEENIYILDLEIKGEKDAGLKFSKEIRERDPKCSIIFLTVHDEYLYLTYKYQVEALDFIIKSYNKIEHDLTKDFQKVITKNHQKYGNSVLLRNHYNYFRMPIEDILFFSSNPDNTHQTYMYTTSNKRRIVNLSLKDLEGLVSNDFFRSHRSYLVNVNNIKSVDVKKHVITFPDTEAVAVLSRLKTRSLISLIDSLNVIKW